MKFLSIFFFIIGLLSLALGGSELYLRENPSRLAFDNYTYAVGMPSAHKNIPVRITIDALAIDAPVSPVVVENNKWPVTGKAASYLAASPIPGEAGNSIIYAHNWKNLFANLTNAQTGEEVVITFADGSKKTFVISSTSTVTPDTSSILANANDTRITLYTCTGFLDTNRFVAVATVTN
ncbi:MAG: class F sortase [Candidatus Levybacteria bacterium]|nr:class F sortase [Candidatus Levybacteria bacterium]